LTEWGRPEAARAIVRVDEQPLLLGGSCQAALMFGSLAPTIKTADAVLLADQLLQLHTSTAPQGKLKALVRDVPVETAEEPAHLQGYKLATDLAEASGLASKREYVDVERFLDVSGVSVREISLSDRRIRAISVAGPEHTPAVLLNLAHETNCYPTGRRFTLAHELSHLLFDRGYGTSLALASGPWAPRDIERRANAFAAMFLMPRGLLSKACGADIASEDAVARVARRLKTSFTATLEHLTNLGFLSEADRDKIRLGADNVRESELTRAKG
jgi:Zn-dependent peptidase ImmA (M78 family)